MNRSDHDWISFVVMNSRVDRRLDRRSPLRAGRFHCFVEVSDDVLSGWPTAAWFGHALKRRGLGRVAGFLSSRSRKLGSPTLPGPPNTASVWPWAISFPIAHLKRVWPIFLSQTAQTDQHRRCAWPSNLLQQTRSLGLRRALPSSTSEPGDRELDATRCPWRPRPAGRLKRAGDPAHVEARP